MMSPSPLPVHPCTLRTHFCAATDNETTVLANAAALQSLDAARKNAALTMVLPSSLLLLLLLEQR